MPELPEVETTCRGIAPHLMGRRIDGVVVREHRLRWPVAPQLVYQMPGLGVRRISRRAKYLLLETDNGCLIVHLGMSGSLRVVPHNKQPDKHDHVDLVLDDGNCLRLRDPRRFGCMVWSDGKPTQHPLLADLGPEPWDEKFSGEYLYRLAGKRKVAVKNFIMDAHTVVGVGNIYANEALFGAGIDPRRAAGRISKKRYQRLAQAIIDVLDAAIEQGGTTLRDFVNSDGEPGYFSLELKVYDREGDDCTNCGRPIKREVIGQRSTFFCNRCQR